MSSPANRVHPAGKPGILARMGIEIAEGTAQRLVHERSSALIQVRSPEPAASQALEVARARISRLEAGHDEVPYLVPGETAGPKMISEVIPEPAGPMLALDLGEDLPLAKIREIPGLIAAALHENGVTEASVRCPERGGALDRLIRYGGRYPLGAGMLLWAPVRRPVPESWVDAAISWLSGLGGHLAVNVGGVQSETDLETGRRLLRQVADSRSAHCLMVAGDLAERVRTVHVTTVFTNRFTLAERGPALAPPDRVRTAEALAAIGRDIAADVEYAAVDLDVGDSFSASAQCGTYTGGFEHWGTELAEGAYWWQLLGDGHLARMTGACTPLPVPGRYELSHGDPGDWLPDQPSRARLQQECRQLLGRCFDQPVRNPAGGLMLPQL